jgi:drug/metabolite transporter (DMT)-like permease
MILARLLMLVTVTFWGWSFVATKICLDYMTPVEIIGLRYLLGLPVLLAIILFKQVRIHLSRHDTGVILLASGVITVHFLIQVTGMKYTTATNTGWLIAVTPLVLALLSVIFLKESITHSAVAGVAVATVGILLLVSKGHVFELTWLKSTGDWLVLGSAHTWALYTVLTRDVTRRSNPLLVSFAVLAFSAVVILGLMAFTADWNKLRHLPLEPVIAILFLGVGCLALAFWFWQEGVSRLGAAKAGFFLYLEPLATTGLAVPYLNESFGLFTAIGGLMVLAGVYLTERRQPEPPLS